ncbi:MAG: cell wall hydrolase [Nitrospirales bacterium]|nr:cell wall hydrolase [Nitrospirales bacterium]
MPLQMIHPKDSTHSDDTLAALTIYLEARGESFAGKLAVAAVIRNRMTHKYHSDGTVKGTVLRAKQFEPWMGRNPEEVKFDQTNRIMQESLLAWRLVQDGRKVVDGAVLFYNPQLVKTPRWAQVNRKVAKIGGHEFFNKHTI